MAKINSLHQAKLLCCLKRKLFIFLDDRAEQILYLGNALLMTQKRRCSKAALTEHFFLDQMEKFLADGGRLMKERQRCFKFGSVLLVVCLVTTGAYI